MIAGTLIVLLALGITAFGRWKYRRGWHKGRVALLREQDSVRAQIDRGDRVIRLSGPTSTEEMADYSRYARQSAKQRHPSLYDREAEA